METEGYLDLPKASSGDGGSKAGGAQVEVEVVAVVAGVDVDWGQLEERETRD